MAIGERFGLQRFPVVTATVFAVTALSNILQFCVPGMLEHLQRTPAGLHGDWWRTPTSLFVQDGGVAGTLSNLAFLVALGAVAEQVISRPGRPTARPSHRARRRVRHRHCGPYRHP